MDGEAKTMAADKKHYRTQVREGMEAARLAGEWFERHFIRGTASGA